MFEHSQVPRIIDYTAAAELHADAMNRVGGAWVYAMRLEEASQSRPNARIKLATAGGFASIIERKYPDDTLIDPMYRSTHAFKHGFMSGFAVAEIAHDGLIDHMGILGSIQSQLDARFGENGEQDEWEEYLFSMGEYGLGVIGNDATNEVESWSEEYVRDVRLQRIYKLGVGATLYAANLIHQGYIEKITEEMINAADWSDILHAVDTGE